ncbi:MAG TPA: helix-turn-helix transcriptional regulator [Galbitalea sp.]|nr:helix-turn-helix transcriptional regulator [Galbitalea sp.]
MSSIRLYILDALVEEGPMHGHQLRLLAEKEHVQEWTDFSVGALYGALKRLTSDGLIEEVRAEREGAYPERQVYAITDAGRTSLGVEKRNALREIVVRPDPFDLGLSRLDGDHLDDLDDMLSARIAHLRALLAETQAHNSSIGQYLTFTEKFVISHKTARIRAEIDWHEELYKQLPEIIAAEQARKDA